MKRTVIIPTAVAAFLMSVLFITCPAADDKPPEFSLPKENTEAVQNRLSRAAADANPGFDGRLVYYVDGSRFDEVSELPADEENITWGVVYETAGQDGKSGYLSRKDR